MTVWDGLRRRKNWRPTQKTKIGRKKKLKEKEKCEEREEEREEGGWVFERRGMGERERGWGCWGRYGGERREKRKRKKYNIIIIIYQIIKNNN